MGIFHLIISLVFLQPFSLSKAETFFSPTANLSTSWINDGFINLSRERFFTFIRPILLRGSSGPSFACGFFCNGTCDSYLFAVFIVETDGSLATYSYSSTHVVWSANRNNPVRLNSTLELKSNGDLVLEDFDGTVVWSTGTAGRSVAGLNLTELGNLVLFDRNNSVVWQSFDHPTDVLVPGQKLIAGMKLIPSVSPTNSTQFNLFSLFVTNEGMFASVGSNPAQVFDDGMSVYGEKTNRAPTYVMLQNGSFVLFVNSSDLNYPDRTYRIPNSSSAQYVKFWADGHLRVHQLGGDGWQVVADLLKSQGDECFYPTVCGSYGICSNGQCSCPSGTANGRNYFNPVDERKPNLGCSEATPLSCQGLQNHSFIELKDATYSALSADLSNVDSESCKNACLRNCSCKAAIYFYFFDSARGFCYLPNQVYSLINNDKEKTRYNSTVYLKVQNASTVDFSPTPNADTTVRNKQKRKRRMAIVLSSTIVPFTLVLVGFLGLLVWKKRRVDESEEDYLDQVPGLPTRFTYEELKAFTDNFSTKLGEGGFGSVFKGTLADGTKIAVKRMNGIGQMKKSFLAEVESIGSIQHVNLVRLLGFCVDKSNMLLVYEFMCNGSLDKWIFNQNPENTLDWRQRKKIILDIAKGLNYLHYECAQKIIHLDIKPQNILLDDKFNAKISDFGLSKIVNRDESKVVTTMRGTRGYLAPEWLSSTITEKVDIYSFGVVVLEMLCGRRNVDNSQPEETMRLLALFETKAEEDKLSDLIDEQSGDMQVHKDEICSMMKISGWCLQKDYAKRPSISMVVKALEGGIEVEQNIDYDLSNPAMLATWKESTALLPSVLSGPR